MKRKNLDEDKATECWELIYKHLYQPLCYFSFELVKDFEKAEDVVQTTLMKLWKNGTVFNSLQHARNYLYKSVKNASLNEIKSDDFRSRAITKLEEENYNIYFQEDHFDVMVKAELYKRILDAINTLPIQSAKVFKLAYIEQKSNPEIAEILSISVNTVKVHKNTAKQKLRKILKDLSLAITVLCYFADI